VTPSMLIVLLKSSYSVPHKKWPRPFFSLISVLLASDPAAIDLDQLFPPPLPFMYFFFLKDNLANILMIDLGSSPPCSHHSSPPPLLIDFGPSSP